MCSYYYALYKYCIIIIMCIFSFPPPLCPDSYLEPDRSKGGKRKTSVMKNTNNPIFEQSFEFANITEEGVKERALEVGIWDNEAIGSASFLGGVRLGLGSGRSQSSLWNFFIFVVLF